MDLINELNEAIEFIEEHLEDELNLEDIAKHSSYSAYHFQRFFNYISGIPLSEYIRRRRLSRAAFELQNGEKVIDVALRYGYMSADSFTRAFTKQHGITPRECKKETISMELYPPMKFQLTIQGRESLKCRIETKKAFSMFGVDTQLDKSWDERTTSLAIEEFISECKSKGIYSEMNSIYGYSSDMVLHRAFKKRNNSQIEFGICQHLKDGFYVPDYFKRIYIPGGQWAIFHAEEGSMEEIWNRIYTEWLKDSGYEIRDEYAFELYYGNAKKGNVRSEIMIPIQKLTSNTCIGGKKKRLMSKRGEMIAGKYHIEEFEYDPSWDEPLQKLYMKVFEKYPNGIYWSYDPRSNEGKHVFLCLDKDNSIIGKGHAMIFERQEDDAPGYAEHRIFIHYRVLPEYENDKEALDLLYERVLECAKELRKQLSNRVCQLCIGNKVFEEVYNKHIESREWPEYGSIYHFERETKSTLLDITQVDDVNIRPFHLDSEEIIRQLVINDQICFRDCISSVDYYMDVSKEEYIAYGAFHADENGKEHLVGSVITEIHDNLPPEISGVMILPEYRRKHIASYMLEYTLDALNKKGHKGVWLVTPCNNEAGIELYKKNGFSIVSKENRYMKYL